MKRQQRSVLVIIALLVIVLSAATPPVEKQQWTIVCVPEDAGNCQLWSGLEEDWAAIGGQVFLDGIPVTGEGKGQYMAKLIEMRFADWTAEPLPGLYECVYGPDLIVCTQKAGAPETYDGGLECYGAINRADVVRWSDSAFSIAEDNSMLLDPEAKQAECLGISASGQYAVYLASLPSASEGKGDPEMRLFSPAEGIIWKNELAFMPTLHPSKDVVVFTMEGIIWSLDIPAWNAIYQGDGYSPTFNPKGDTLFWAEDETLWMKAWPDGEPVGLEIGHPIMSIHGADDGTVYFQREIAAGGSECVAAYKDAKSWGLTYPLCKHG